MFLNEHLSCTLALKGIESSIFSLNLDDDTVDIMYNASQTKFIESLRAYFIMRYLVNVFVARLKTIQGTHMSHSIFATSVEKWLVFVDTSLDHLQSQFDQKLKASKSTKYSWVSFWRATNLHRAVITWLFDIIAPQALLDLSLKELATLDDYYLTIYTTTNNNINTEEYYWQKFPVGFALLDKLISFVQLASLSISSNIKHTVSRPLFSTAISRIASTAHRKENISIDSLRYIIYYSIFSTVAQSMIDTSFNNNNNNYYTNQHLNTLLQDSSSSQQVQSLLLSIDIEALWFTANNSEGQLGQQQGSHSHGNGDGDGNGLLSAAFAKLAATIAWNQARSTLLSSLPPSSTAAAIAIEHESSREQQPLVNLTSMQPLSYFDDSLVLFAKQHYANYTYNDNNDNDTSHTAADTEEEKQALQACLTRLQPPASSIFANNDQTLSPILYPPTTTTRPPLPTTTAAAAAGAKLPADPDPIATSNSSSQSSSSKQQAQLPAADTTLTKLTTIIGTERTVDPALIQAGREYLLQKYQLLDEEMERKKRKGIWQIRRYKVMNERRIRLRAIYEDETCTVYNMLVVLAAAPLVIEMERVDAKKSQELDNNLDSHEVRVITSGRGAAAASDVQEVEDSDTTTTTAAAAAVPVLTSKQESKEVQREATRQQGGEEVRKETKLQLVVTVSVQAADEKKEKGDDSDDDDDDDRSIDLAHELTQQHDDDDDRSIDLAHELTQQHNNDDNELLDITIDEIHPTSAAAVAVQQLRPQAEQEQEQLIIQRIRASLRLNDVEEVLARESLIQSLSSQLERSILLVGYHHGLVTLPTAAASMGSLTLALPFLTIQSHANEANDDVDDDSKRAMLSRIYQLLVANSQHDSSSLSRIGCQLLSAMLPHALQAAYSGIVTLSTAVTFALQSAVLTHSQELDRLTLKRLLTYRLPCITSRSAPSAASSVRCVDLIGCMLACCEFFVMSPFHPSSFLLDLTRLMVEAAWKQQTMQPLAATRQAKAPGAADDDVWSWSRSATIFYPALQEAASRLHADFSPYFAYVKFTYQPRLHPSQPASGQPANSQPVNQAAGQAAAAYYPLVSALGLANLSFSYTPPWPFSIFFSHHQQQQSGSGSGSTIIDLIRPFTCRYFELGQLLAVNRIIKLEMTALDKQQVKSKRKGLPRIIHVQYFRVQYIIQSLVKYFNDRATVIVLSFFSQLRQAVASSKGSLASIYHSLHDYAEQLYQASFTPSLAELALSDQAIADYLIDSSVLVRLCVHHLLEEIRLYLAALLEYIVVCCSQAKEEDDDDKKAAEASSSMLQQLQEKLTMYSQMMEEYLQNIAHLSWMIQQQQPQQQQQGLGLVRKYGVKEHAEALRQYLCGHLTTTE